LDNGAWAVRVYVKPFVRWIWLGGLFMMLGGFVAATDRRFRALPERRDDSVESAAATTQVAEAGA
jgi:cytochrome c-type biogenesis protein CcmF